MNNYFVVFYAENNGKLPMNDVIEYAKEISNIEDIKNIENIIEKEWFNDGREVRLLNFKKLELPTQHEAININNECLFCDNQTPNSDKVCDKCREGLQQDAITEQLGGWCSICGTYYGECGCD